MIASSSGAGKQDEAERLLISETEVAFARDRHAIITAHAIVSEAQGEAERALELFNDAAQRWAEYGFVLEERRLNRNRLQLDHRSG
jgi:hypothetical protein